MTNIANSVSSQDPGQIVVAGTFTLDPLVPGLEFWMEELSLRFQISLAPYKQVFQELLHPDSQLCRNARGMNVIVIRIQDWQFETTEYLPKLEGLIQDHSFIREHAKTFIEALRSSLSYMRVPLLVVMCPCSTNPAPSTEGQIVFQEIEQTIAREVEMLPGVDMVSSADLHHTYPVLDYEDPQANEVAHIPYVPIFYSVLSTVIMRRFHALCTPPCKVIMVDADHTLWDGVCGEDGPHGIKLSESYSEFQEYLVQQTQAGRLVCIVSKNNEEDVRQVFQTRTDMVLRLEHVTAIRANWEPKSENIRLLAQELNLGLDSVVFLDNDPVECAEVTANCPAVLAFQLPPNTIDRMPFLKHLWALDLARASKVGRARTELYHQQAKREQFRQQVQTLQDFLVGLNLVVTISPISQEFLERVSELTHRTNQFNCTTKRRTVTEIHQALSSHNMTGSVVNVQDRFGDYGLVGVMLYTPLDDTLSVDTFLLSCRALGRGVEHHMVASLGRQAEKQGLSTITLPFIPTPKNQPAWNFLQSAASAYHHSHGDESVFVLPASIASSVSYQPTELRSQENSLMSDNDMTSETAPDDLDHSLRAEQLHSMALFLASPEQIHEAITSANVMERDPDTPFVAPRTELEQHISSICAEVLGVRQISVNDNFFSLGVHSLLMMQVIARIRERFHLDLSIQSFFLTPTVAGITQALLESTGEGESPSSSTKLSKEVVHLSTEDITAIASEVSSLFSTSPDVISPIASSHFSDSVPSSSQIHRHHADRYRLSSVSRIPNGMGEETLYAPQSGRSVRVPSSFAEVLSSGKRFYTQNELSEMVLQAPQNKIMREPVQALLNQLIENNLLISESAFVRKLASQSSVSMSYPEDPGINTLGIVTGNRPQTLQRCLESYFQNCQATGKTLHSLIIDDSAKPEVCQEYRERLQSLHTKFNLPITYIGRQELQQFVENLRREGDIPHSVIEFALVKPSHSPLFHSGNRNTLLLATGGELVFSADDDTLCQAVASPAMSQGLGLISDTDPSDYWFFPNRESLLRERSLQSTDVLHKIEELLGKGPAQIVANKRPGHESIAVHDINDELLKRLQDPQARVTLTFPGLIGDCGWGAPFGFWGDPMGFLLMEGDSHSRLTHTEEHYRQSCKSREILRVTPTPTLSDASFSMSTFLGMDNRELLPPFFPFGRGSDTLFGWTTWHSLPHSLVGHIPWALLHAPQDPRMFHQGELLRTASAFDSSKILFACLAMFQWNSYQDDPAQRLLQMGKFLREIGQLSPSKFEECIRVAALHYNSRFERMIEQRLQASESMPKYWAQDLEQYLILLRKSELGNDYWVPLDLALGVSLSIAKERTSKFILQFGELLCWWPTMRDAAQALKTKGESFGDTHTMTFCLLAMPGFLNNNSGQPFTCRGAY